MKIYWRQFVGWVTDLKDKYWSDPFFRSEFNVIALQFLFAAILLLIVGVAFNYLYQDISDILIGGIEQSIKDGQTTGTGILETAQDVKTEKFYGFFIITLLITLGFSYLIAKVTLTPVRNALNLQKRFVSDIAHELRTPLSIIKTHSEVALMDEGVGVEMQKTLKSIVEELDRTSEIINNLLSLSNLVRPEPVSFTAVDLGLTVDSSVKKLQNMADQKGINISVRKVTPHTVLGNATALEQVALNLLKNAIAYTPKGGEVSMVVEPDYQGNVLLTVQDSGIGISKEDLLHIFKPFYRAERSRNRAMGSSGLGLTIVNELVKLYSGRISIQSSPNRGTTAVVIFPYDKKIAPK